MKALVTGGAGFIGRALVADLTRRGDEVVSFDRVPRAQGSGEVVGDLGSWPHVLEVVEALRPDVIFHTGALLSAFAESDVPGAVMGNASGTFHVLEAAKLFGVGQVVFTSTIATYGRASGDTVNDDSPQFPSSIYGVTKVYGERLGEYYSSRFGIDFRAIRFPSVVGPGRGASGLSAYTSLMIEKGLSGERYTVPLSEDTAIPIMFVDDCVRALLEIAGADASRLTRKCYLVAGISPTAAQIAASVRSVTPGADIRFEPDAEAQAIVDSWPRAIDESGAREDWDWKAAFDLDAIVGAFAR